MSDPVIIREITKNRRERLRVCLDNYQGDDLIDLRITTQLTEATDVWVPTKKGVCVNVALLPDLIAALNAARTKAQELGLIGGDADG